MEKKMSGSQPNSEIFSVRIVSIDYYMAPPIQGADICYSSFHGTTPKRQRFLGFTLRLVVSECVFDYAIIFSGPDEVFVFHCFIFY